MTIYISTGGYKNKSADETVELLVKNNLKEIELSGGLYNPNLVDNLRKYLDYGVKFQVHNYFPPTRKTIYYKFSLK